ncbi:MAG: hypothetical protein FJ336_03795 [Sphingomonadales bacterium]|nr:hypothetical protein [Sphingomonadales bacterium]
MLPTTNRVMARARAARIHTRMLLMRALTVTVRAWELLLLYLHVGEFTYLIRGLALWDKILDKKPVNRLVVHHKKKEFLNPTMCPLIM